jgi:hypothetical protein
MFQSVVAVVAVGTLLAPSVAHVFSARRTVQMRLKLRELEAVAEMRHAPPHPSIFMAEFNRSFLFMTEIVDFGVMKYLGDARVVKLLWEQEKKHVDMHRAGLAASRKDGDQMRRFALLYFISDMLMLRLGYHVGVCFASGMETASTTMFYTFGRLAAATDAGTLSDISLFHIFEECEHGPVTVQALKPRTSLPLRILLLPLMVVLPWAMFCTPLFTAWFGPGASSAALKHPLRTAAEFLKYALVSHLTFLSAVYVVLAYWLPSVAVPPPEHSEAAARYFEAQLKARRVLWTEVATEQYPVCA